MSAEAVRARLTKWSKSLMNEGFRGLKWTCPLCCIGKFLKLPYTTKSAPLRIALRRIGRCR